MSNDRLDAPGLASLREGDVFEGYYVVREASLHTAVNGKGYIRLTLGDATGALGGNIWDANTEMYQLCAPGGVVKLHGAVESYKNRLQVRIARFRPAREGEYDLESFLPKSARSPGDMRSELSGLLASATDPDCARILAAFFGDPELLDRFLRAPAAREVHHAWVGGLAEHTLSVARMADGFARNAAVDRDLLLAGALLHDIGKIEELAMGLSIEYTDRGKLLGHLYIGSEMLRLRAAGLGDFPESKLVLLQHLILSHHGRHEYGSPTLPKTPEAFALHHLDNLDAKVTAANRLIAGIQDPDKRWTEFSRTLETALFRAPPMNRGAADA